MGHKVTLEEAKERLFNNHGTKIELVEYDGMGKSATFKCNVCGNIWSTIANSIIDKDHGCKKCSYVNKPNPGVKYTEEYIRNYIEENGCKWVDGEYKNGDSKLNIQFECGHIYPMAYSNFRAGQRCKECGRKVAADKQRKKISEIIEIVENNGFKFLDVIIRNDCRRPDLKYECQYGHITIRNYDCFVLHPACGECKRLDVIAYHTKPIADVREIIESRNCIPLEIDHYVDEHTEILIKFECGHTGNTTLANFRSKTTSLCNDCARELAASSRRLKESDIVEETLSAGFVFVEFPDGYKNNNDSMIYLCDKGHENKRTVAGFLSNKTCTECSLEYIREIHTGENNKNWKGGLTPLRTYLSKRIDDWKKKNSAENNYLCVVTGKPMEQVHHLVTFSNILKMAINDIGLVMKKTIGEYTVEELDALVEKFRELHLIFPGVPVTKSAHMQFHSLYGNDGSNTPEQWYEFVDRVKSGEIIIEENKNAKASKTKNGKRSESKIDRRVDGTESIVARTTSVYTTT